MFHKFAIATHRSTESYAELHQIETLLFGVLLEWYTHSPTAPPPDRELVARMCKELYAHGIAEDVARNLRDLLPPYLDRNYGVICATLEKMMPFDPATLHWDLGPVDDFNDLMKDEEIRNAIRQNRDVFGASDSPSTH